MSCWDLLLSHSDRGRLSLNSRDLINLREVIGFSADRDVHMNIQTFEIWPEHDAIIHGQKATAQDAYYRVSKKWRNSSSRFCKTKAGKWKM